MAGIGPIMGPPGTPSTWSTYFAVGDADAAAERIASAGGMLISGPMDVMDVGRLVVAAPATDTAAWERIFRLREVASAVLERARNAKQIGKALEADLTLHTAAKPAALLGSLKVDLSMIFLTSHVDFKPADDSLTDFVEFEDIGRVAVSMGPARGRKCGRCWLYREEVENDGELCARCQSVVDGLAPEEMPTV